MKLFPYSIFCCVFFLIGCGPSPDQDPGTSASDRQPLEAETLRRAEDALTFGQAQARKARIGEIHYQLFFDLVSSEQVFSGRSILRFDLSQAESPLTIDLSGAEVDSVVANGSEIDTSYNGFFITVPATDLVIGTNEIQVEYSHRYDKDGTGLHRFTDPEDGLTYLYTYLWPYYANRLFPSFDQPNLKATFDLQVKAPASWTVISTASGVISDRSDSVSTWTFATSRGWWQRYRSITNHCGR